MTKLVATPGEGAVPLRRKQRLDRTTEHAWIAAVSAAIVTAVVVARPDAAAGAAPPAGIALVAAVRAGLGWRVRHRLARGRRDHPSAPWTWDRAWSAMGETRAPGRSAVRDILFGTFLVGLVLLVGYAILAVAPTPFVLLLAVAGLGGVWFVWTGWQDATRGALAVSFRRFPFFTGERAEMSLGVSESGGAIESATIFLRRVEEFPGMRPRVWVTWSQTFDAPEGLLPGPGGDLAIAFDVPAEVGATRLDGPRPRYYELCVNARSNGGEFRERFLVPVYDRPAGPAAA